MCRRRQWLLSRPQGFGPVRRIAAELGARRVLDVGCGTGTLALMPGHGGHGGIAQVARTSGLHPETVPDGMAELAAGGPVISVDPK